MGAPLLQHAYRTMRRRFGHRNWWPGETPFEVMVGAILTQNTAWTNVEKAIKNLKREKLLKPRALYDLRPARLARLIRSAGYFRVKTKRLRHFLKYFLENYAGDATRMRKEPLEKIRRELLAVNGIGPETADSILLYALGKPVFVVDAYTRRILNRHGLCRADAEYDRLQNFFTRRVKPSLFNDFHAQIVHTGKDFCRTRPRCGGCPLQGWNWRPGRLHYR